MTILIVSNPAAARARRHLEALRQAMPEGAANHVLSERPDELAALVGHDRWRPDDLLVINGGDGSVQHALTELAAHCPARQWPRLACLPGGTTNMTAYDLNRHRRFRDCLETLRGQVRQPDPDAVAPRAVVRVGPGDGRRDQCGLFFGTGTIVQGIEYFHARVRPSGGGHELGAGVALARTLWGIVRREPPFAQPLQVALEAPDLLPAAGAPPHPAANGGAGPCTATPLSVRLLLVTALDRLFLGIRPYWRQGDAALKATLVTTAARHFVRSMPRLLRGRPGPAMTPAHGYYSGGVGQLRLRFTGSYTLDGELFTNAGDIITVSPTDPVRFLPL